MRRPRAVVRTTGILLAAALTLSGCAGGGVREAAAGPTSGEGGADAPFPGVTASVTGIRTSEPRRDAVEIFVAGAAYAQSEGVVPAELREVLGKELQRVISAGAAKVEAKGWTVSTHPIAHVESVVGNRRRATVRLCRWSPSTDWRRADSGVLVQDGGRRWHALRLGLRFDGDHWRIVQATVDGTCVRKAPQGAGSGVG